MGNESPCFFLNLLFLFWFIGCLLSGKMCIDIKRKKWGFRLESSLGFWKKIVEDWLVKNEYYQIAGQSATIASFPFRVGRIAKTQNCNQRKNDEKNKPPVEGQGGKGGSLCKQGSLLRKRKAKGRTVGTSENLFVPESVWNTSACAFEYVYWFKLHFSHQLSKHVLDKNLASWRNEVIAGVFHPQGKCDRAAQHEAGRAKCFDETRCLLHWPNCEEYVCSNTRRNLRSSS